MTLRAPFALLLALSAGCEFAVRGLKNEAPDASVDLGDPNGSEADLAVAEDLATATPDLTAGATDLLGVPCLANCTTTCAPCCQDSCVGGASCIQNCGPGCMCDLKCSSTGSCTMNCGGNAGCTGEIANAGNSAMNCASGASCALYCHNSNPCSMACTLGAQCLLRCVDNGACTFSQCGGAVSSCANGIIVCNRACP